MAAKPKTSRAPKVAVRTVTDFVGPFTAAYGEGQNAIFRAQVSQLDMLREALKDCPATTHDQFKANVRPALMTALTGLKRADGTPHYASKDSAMMAASQLAVVWIGFSNGVLPEKGETTVKTYYAGAKPRLVAAGIYAAQRASTPTPAGSKAKPASNAQTSKGEASADPKVKASPEQILAHVFKLLGQDNVPTNRVERLALILRQRPTEFWRKMDTISTNT